MNRGTNSNAACFGLDLTRVASDASMSLRRFCSFAPVAKPSNHFGCTLLNCWKAPRCQIGRTKQPPGKTNPSAPGDEISQKVFNGNPIGGDQSQVRKWSP